MARGGTHLAVVGARGHIETIIPEVLRVTEAGRLHCGVLIVSTPVRLEEIAYARSTSFVDFNKCHTIDSANIASLPSAR